MKIIEVGPSDKLYNLFLQKLHDEKNKVITVGADEVLCFPGDGPVSYHRDSVSFFHEDQTFVFYGDEDTVIRKLTGETPPTMEKLKGAEGQFA